MADSSTERLSQSDGLARIIDGIIRERLAIEIGRNEEYLAQQERHLHLIRARRQQFWQRLTKWSRLFNTWIWAILLIACAFLLGTYAGLNWLPDGVVCGSPKSLCYQLRIHGLKGTIR
jgi:hypothetical protein